MIDPNHPLIQAMLAHLQPMPQQQTAHPANRAALARAMLGRRGPEGQKNASLAALPAWREQHFGSTFDGQQPTPQGAFQGDAFQNDAFQVDGVI